MEPAPRRPPWVAIGTLALVLAVVAWVRVRLVSVPFERDEGEYAYMGQLVNQGIPPYVAAYNMKLPGTYAMYALFLRLFGDTAEAVRIGLLLVNAASIVLVYLVARGDAGGAGALAAAVAYAAMTLSPSVYGTFAHATHFVVVFALAGLWVLGWATRTGRSWAFAAAGALFGLSILMKQNGAFFAALGAGQLVRSEWTSAPRALRRAATRLGLLALGAAVPLGAVAAVLVAAGAWSRFWFWVVSYAGAYVSQVPLAQAPAYLAYAGGAIVKGAPLLTAYALAGLVWAAWDAWRTRRAGFALVFALASAAAVCPGFWFRPHYFLLLLPAAAVLVGLAAAALERSLDGLLSPAGRAVAVVALAALAGAQALYTHRAILFESSPRESSRLTYPQQPFVESVDVASYIRSRTEPSDRIAVLGSEPQIYFYARRRGATGYLYTYPMMEPQPFARRMQDEMIAEVEAARPLFVVFVSATSSWMARQESDLAIVDWANRFVKEKYRLVGIAETPEDEGPPALFWDEALRTYRQHSRNRLLVYRRKG